MECKVQYKRKHEQDGRDLIDTLWNVKYVICHATDFLKEDLIDTLWNVKLKGFPIGRTKNGI